MTKNQKIALGCGGAGCLGLIVVAIAGGLIYYLVSRPPARSRDYNFNVSTNRNSNSNDNTDFSTNTNDNDNSNANSTNSNSSSPSSTSASSLSDDDKHKLYQAAMQTGDQELIRRVSVKIGIMDEDYTPGAEYQKFISEHVEWVIRNTEFIGTVNSPEKARAYVNDHFPE
jgi:K+-transporting ATPase c subunit